MKTLLYLASLALAVPGVALAAWVCTVDHVIATRNVFTLIHHFLLASGRGLPALVLAVALLIAAGFFPLGRLVAGAVVVLLDVAALAVIVFSPAAPKTFSEAVFLLPAIVSITLAAVLVAGHVRDGQATASRAGQPAATARLRAFVG